MRQCEMCAKSSKMVGHRIKLRGKFNPTNWSRKYANLQYATIEGKRMHICTGCIRTLHKTPRVKVTKKATAGATA